jgi:hypothetical protein
MGSWQDLLVDIHFGWLGHEAIDVAQRTVIPSGLKPLAMTDVAMTETP